MPPDVRAVLLRARLAAALVQVHPLLAIAPFRAAVMDASHGARQSNEPGAILAAVDAALQELT
jgi:hypothetical protein